MAFCLNTLLDVGYAPGGSWVQISTPIGGPTFTIDNSNDNGCIDELTLTLDQLTSNDPLNTCLTPGTYQFEYTTEVGCFLPVTVDIVINDSPTELATPPDIYVCRDGTESTNFDYTYQTADGTVITSLSLNEYIRQCDGNIIDYPIEVVRNATGTSVFADPSIGDNYQFNWFNFNNAVNYPVGFLDDFQSCTGLILRRTDVAGLECGVEIPFSLVVSPIMAGGSDTIESCDNPINIYDNMPQSLVDFILATVGSLTTTGEGTLAKYFMNTLGYNGCTPPDTGTITIQYSVGGGGFFDLQTNTLIDPTIPGNETISYKVIWTPFGTVGFDCGFSYVLNIVEGSCCIIMTADGSFEDCTGDIPLGFNSNADIECAGFVDVVGSCNTWVSPGPIGYDNEGTPASPNGGIFANSLSYQSPLFAEVMGADICLISGQTYTISFHQTNGGKLSSATIGADEARWVVKVDGNTFNSATRSFEGFGSQTWTDSSFMFTSSVTGTIQVTFEAESVGSDPNAVVSMCIDGIVIT